MGNRYLDSDDRIAHVKGKRKFTVLIERDEEGSYVATVPGLPGCHTQAKTLDALMRRAKEAIELCLEADRGNIVPVDIVGIQHIYV